MPIFNKFEHFVNIGSRLEHFQENETDNSDGGTVDIGALTAKSSIEKTIEELRKRIKVLEQKVVKLEGSR